MGKGLIGCGLVALLVIGVVVMMAMGVYKALQTSSRRLCRM